MGQRFKRFLRGEYTDLQRGGLVLLTKRKANIRAWVVRRRGLSESEKHTHLYTYEAILIKV